MTHEEIAILKAEIKAELIDEIKSGLTISVERDSSYINIKLCYEGDCISSDSVSVQDDSTR